MTGTPDRLRTRILNPLASALLTLRAASMMVWLAFLLPYSMDISFPEGAVAARAWSVARGGPAYTDWREWPHQFAPYGPLTYYPAGVLARICAKEPTPRMLYLIGRAQSLTALAGLCLICAWMVRRITGSWRRGLLAIPFALSWEPALTFVASYRPDAPQAALGLAALLIAMSGPATGRRSLAAFTALSVAMWFKPSAWGCGFALALWTYETGGAGRSAAVIAIFGGINLLLLLLADRLTGGLLVLNMLHSMNNGIAPDNLARFFGGVAGIPGLILMTGVLHSAWRFARGGVSDSERLLHFACSAEFLASAVQVMKVGADINYLLTAYTLAAVSTLLLVIRHWFDPQARPGWHHAVRMLILIPMLLIDSWSGARGMKRDLMNVKSAWKPVPLAEEISRTTGLILTMNPFASLTRPEAPSILDHVQYSILVERGLLDDKALIDRIEGRRFEVIVLPEEEGRKPANWFGPRFAPALETNYTAEGRLANMVIHRPKKGAPEPSRDPARN